MHFAKCFLCIRLSIFITIRMLVLLSLLFAKEETIYEEVKKYVQ